jgi:uncharacterized protein (UPF0262 family)
MSDARFKIARIDLDERSVGRRGADVEHERAVAIFDLLESNRFEPVGDRGGPYHLRLGLEESRLVFEVSREDGEEVGRVRLPLAAFRSTIRDYFTVCESYYEAIKHATPQRIETLDMGRRALHDEGSALLRERLKGRLAIDHDTARRLFTLLCVLHVRG